MHKALSANLHDAKASASSKCVFEIARQIACYMDSIGRKMLLQL
jgi:hypothetical protein